VDSLAKLTATGVEEEDFERVFTESFNEEGAT